jgi:hypothetical protein
VATALEAYNHISQLYFGAAAKFESKEIYGYPFTFCSILSFRLFADTKIVLLEKEKVKNRNNFNRKKNHTIRKLAFSSA